MSTKIEWTDEVWNPVTGCTKVSAGCKHCYAETIAERFWGDQTVPVVINGEYGVFTIPGQTRPRRFTDVLCHPERLGIPLKWKKPRRIFVNSMSDLFHEEVDHEFIQEVWWRMQMTPRHTYQILTKRPERMAELITHWWDNGGPILDNVWLGVSCEDQKTANERIPLLLQTPAAVRFVSLEPLLGEIDLIGSPWNNAHGRDWEKDGLMLDWVIVGGESGPHARPMHPDWARSIRDQCINAGVPFFFKQWGGVQKKKIATLDRGVIIDKFLDGREWNEYPEK